MTQTHAVETSRARECDCRFAEGQCVHWDGRILTICASVRRPGLWRVATSTEGAKHITPTGRASKLILDTYSYADALAAFYAAEQRLLAGGDA